MSAGDVDPRSIRIGGIVNSNSVTAQNDAPWVKSLGLYNDLELDLSGLPSDAAVAWARKPYPTADQKIFAAPDLGDDETGLSPTNLVVWHDLSDTETLTLDSTTGRYEQVTGKFGTSNVLVEPSSDGGPTSTSNGTHHRYSAWWQSTANYLWDTSPTAGQGASNLAVWAVAVRDTNSASDRTLGSVWKLQGNQQAWWLRFNSSHQPVFGVSTNGTSETGTVTASEAVPLGMPVLIYATYNGTTGEMTMTVNNGPFDSAGHSNPDMETASTTGSIFSSNAPFIVGGYRNGSDAQAGGHRGLLSFIAVQTAIPNSSEADAITSYLRRRFGVW